MYIIGWAHLHLLQSPLPVANPIEIPSQHLMQFQLKCLSCGEMTVSSSAISLEKLNPIALNEIWHICI